MIKFVKIIKDNNDKSGKMYKEKYLEKNYNVIYEDIIKFGKKYNLNDLIFKQLLYHYINNIIKKPICICGKVITFINIGRGYNNHCSIECSQKDKIVKNKRKKTFIKKYGVTNPMKLDSIKDKVKKTNIKKYGVDNPAKLDIFLTKMKNTNLKKEGFFIQHKMKKLKRNIIKVL